MSAFYPNAHRLARLGLLACLLTAFFASLANTPAQAAFTPKIQARAGFEGYYRQNSWLPVQVNLDLAEGNPDFDGWLEGSWTNFAGDSPVYRKHIQLVAPASRTVWLYLPSDSHKLAQVQLRLTDEGGATIEKRDLNVQSVGETEILLGLVSDAPKNLDTTLNGDKLSQPYNRGSTLFNEYFSSDNSRLPSTGATAKPTTRIAHLGVGDLPPDMAGWDSLDGLIVSDLNTTQLGDTGLNQEALRQAATGWLSQGRLLVAAGDSSLRRSGFLTELLPVKQAGPPQTGDFPAALRQFAGSTALPDKLLLARVNALPGATIETGTASQPLLVSRPFGLGTSWFLATELQTLPADLINEIWRYVLGSYEPHFGYVEAHRIAQENVYQSWISRVTPVQRQNRLLDTGSLALILLAYVLLLGPLGYLLLKRLNRLEWGWLAVPALGLLFGAGLFIVSLTGGAGTLVLSRLSIVTLGENSQGQLTGGTVGITTLYGGGRAVFQLNTDETALATTLDSTRLSGRASFTGGANPDRQFLSVQEGPGGGFGQLTMGLGEQHSFGVEQNGAAGVGEGIVANLHANSEGLSGTLENRTGSDWSEISVWKPGGQVYNIPPLKAGAKFDLSQAKPAQRFNQLIYTLVGIDRATAAGNIRTPDPTTEEAYTSRRSNVLSTLLGRDGEALPRNANRVYLLAWKQSISDFGLKPDLHGPQYNDLQVLFEPLTLK